MYPTVGNVQLRRLHRPLYRPLDQRKPESCDIHGCLLPCPSCSAKRFEEHTTILFWIAGVALVVAVVALVMV